jgi:hypothetical protein
LNSGIRSKHHEQYEQRAGQNTKFLGGRVETEESESWNGKLKRKTEAESGNGKAEIRKWSSIFLVPIAIVCACAIRLG